MADQLDFAGEAHPFPLRRPRALTQRQRDLLRYVRVYAGQGEPMPTQRAALFFRDASGALRRLERLGLVRRQARGFWRAT